MDTYAEAEGEKKLLLLLIVASISASSLPMIGKTFLWSCTEFCGAFLNFGYQVALPEVHILKRLLADELVADVGLERARQGGPVGFAASVGEHFLILDL